MFSMAEQALRTPEDRRLNQTLPVLATMNVAGRLAMAGERLYLAIGISAAIHAFDARLKHLEQRT